MILIMIYEYDIFNININAIYLIIYSKLSLYRRTYRYNLYDVMYTYI